MASSRKILWAGLGALALPMSAATAQPATSAADICGAIERIAAAASVRPAFLPIQRALAEGRAIVPGFAADECEVTSDGVSCRGRRLSAFNNWPNLDTCRGVVEFEDPPSRWYVRYPSNRTYRFGRLRIARGFRCPGCRALGAPYFTMTFYRPGDWRR